MTLSKLYGMMNIETKYRAILIALLLVVPAALSAQKRPAKKAQKNASKIEEVLPKAQELFNAYAFGEASELLQEAIDKAGKAENDLSKENALLQKAAMGNEMLMGTERVVFIDSIVVDSKNVLGAIRLSPECGRLAALSSIAGKAAWAANLAPAPAYVNQFGDKLLLSYPDAKGVKRIASSIKAGSDWTQPKPLDGMAMVEGEQDFPYLLSDGVTLYFATTGEDCLRGYDLFVTRYDAQEKSYLKAENLGFPFNSPANDYFCIIDETLGVGYLATDRNQPEGKICVYRFIPNESRDVYNASPENLPQVSRAARIASIADSQKGYEAKLDAAFNRLNKLMATNGPADNRSTAVRLVVNDDIVYHALSEFKSPKARRIAAEWLNVERQIGELQQELDKLRGQWAQGKHSDLLGKVIPEKESRLAELAKQKNVMAKNMRAAELAK